MQAGPPGSVFEATFRCVSSRMMDVCGEAEGRLATELMQHELQLEKDILDPLNHLAEVGGTNAGVIVRVLLGGKRTLLCETRLRVSWFL